jgi:hypothetical protein
MQHNELRIRGNMANHGQIDTTNRFGVGSRGEAITVLSPPVHMTKAEALVYAAWIVALADPLGERFQVALEAVQGT